MTDFEEMVFLDALYWWNITQSGAWENTQELMESYWKEKLS